MKVSDAAVMLCRNERFFFLLSRAKLYITFVAANLGRMQDSENGHPPSPFTIFEPRNPWIEEFCVVQECRATDFKAIKLGKCSSGYILHIRGKETVPRSGKKEKYARS